MRQTCLLIPGNPAIERHYRSWIKEIETQRQVEISYATSYVSFSRRLDPVEYDKAMCEHYESLLLQLSSSDKITVIGHSVGGYFALRLLERYPGKIEKVIILFPYIGYSTIKWLRYIWPLYFIDRFFPLAEIVSSGKNFFRKWYQDTEGISNQELTACLRFGVRQCAYFNKHAFDTRSVSLNKEKIYFVYRENDPWCPKETIELLKPISNYKEVHLPHDFIERDNQRIKMIEEAGPWF